MEAGGAVGGGGKAKVPGYRVGGKPGTADKSTNGGYNGEVVASFLGMAPMDDPQISVLVTVDEPSCDVVSGSVTAAPCAREIMENVLRYLDLRPEYTAEEQKALKSDYTTVPDLSGQSLSDAIGILAGKELGYKLTQADLAAAAGEDEGGNGSVEEFCVADQYPKAGETAKKGTAVYLYKE